MEPPVVTFDDPRLEWCNGSPPTISKNPNRVHGPGPRCGISHEDGQLELYPIPQRDYWSRTFYKPLLVKSNGCVRPSVRARVRVRACVRACTYAPVSIV
jgi:hypothetical protein